MLCQEFNFILFLIQCQQIQMHHTDLLYYYLYPIYFHLLYFIFISIEFNYH